MVKISCYHPLKLFYTDSYTDAFGNQKYNTKVCSHDTHHLELSHGEWLPVPVDNVGDCKAVAYRHFEIPCGKCIGCRLDYSRVWANRLMLELSYYNPDTCWFVTLTYRDRDSNGILYFEDGVNVDEVVPFTFYSDAETGEARIALTLKKDHGPWFLKTLRNHYPGERIRFYLCGEYGSTTKRPHMHAIIFGLPLDHTKLVKWKRTSQGFTLFKCPELEKLWKRGNVMVSPVSWETCAYVSRYVVKKLNGNASEFYKMFNLEPEFCLMSRRPGIGRDYYEEHPDCVKKGIFLSTSSRGFHFEAPRYFRNLFKLDNELECAIMASEGTLRQDQKVKNIMAVNDLAESDFQTYLDSAEQEQLSRSKALKRSDV